MKDTMNICFDASALSTPHNGIGRYVSSILEVAQHSSNHHWQAVGRGDLAKKPVQPNLNLHWHDDAMPTHMGRLLAPFFSLPKYLRKNNADVFWSPAHRLPINIPENTARVVTIHDLCHLKAPETMHPVGRWLDGWHIPRAIQKADRIITVSQATANDLIDIFPEAETRIRVTPLAAQPPSDFDESIVPKHNTQRPYFLFVGTTEPRKNLVRLLQAFANNIKHEAFTHQLVLVGGRGWGDSSIKPLLTQNQPLNERVSIMGEVTDAQLAALYKHAHALVLPSLYEGFGLPLMEAMQHGTPVITSNTSSMPEVAADGGLLVNPWSVDDIGQAMLVLANDELLHQTLSTQARQQAAQFSWQKTTEHTLAVFKEAIDARNNKQHP